MTGGVIDDDLVAQVDVGDDALDAAAARAAHEDRRTLLGDHDLRGLPRRRLRLAEQRLAARDRRDRQRAHVGKRAHGAGRLQQALAQVGGHPLQPRRPPEQADGLVLRDAVHQRVLPGAHGELGRQAGEQRRVADDLPGGDDGHVRVLVHQLERAEADHEELLSRRPALDEDGLPLGHGPLAEPRRDPVELGLGQVVERRHAAEEPDPVGDARGIGVHEHASSYLAARRMSPRSSRWRRLSMTSASFLCSSTTSAP